MGLIDSFLSKLRPMDFQRPEIMNMADRQKYLEDAFERSQNGYRFQTTGNTGTPVVLGPGTYKVDGLAYLVYRDSNDIDWSLTPGQTFTLDASTQFIDTGTGNRTTLIMFPRGIQSLGVSLYRQFTVGDNVIEVPFNCDGIIDIVDSNTALLVQQIQIKGNFYSNAAPPWNKANVAYFMQYHLRGYF